MPAKGLYHPRNAEDTLAISIAEEDREPGKNVYFTDQSQYFTKQLDYAELFVRPSVK
ncbi:hypothetical protein SAMN05421809_3531 [Natronorubrum daqingense]|uniref:Uncharacterized protein n=1 Tax=Natronorubrum daqingense TaxID=588898 RepID=A0A1N7FXA8_9EURY|nr:hypothetical protein SAMN05421809_3531 [Natronorubrum daqingense]